MTFSLEDLNRRVADRAGASPDESYTARLLRDGVDRCARKFGEESVELIVSAVSRDKQGHEATGSDDGRHENCSRPAIEEAGRTEPTGHAEVHDGVAGAAGLPCECDSLGRGHRAACDGHPAGTTQQALRKRADDEQAEEVEGESRPSAVLNEQGSHQAPRFGR